jgi:hypothetical protein
MKARRAVRLSLASLVLVACGTTSLGSVFVTSTSASASAPSCEAKDLAAHGGRQGAPFQSVEGSVVIVNGSTSRCVMHVGTTFSLIQSDGVHLSVHELLPTNETPSIVLRAKRSTVLTFFWQNWCRASPGPLTISIALAGRDGVVAGPFNGPPNYSAVPGCINKDKLSTLQLVSP